MARKYIPLSMHKVANVYHFHCLCIPFPMHTIPYQCIPYHTMHIIPYNCQCIPYNGKAMHNTNGIPYHTRKWYGMSYHTIPTPMHTIPYQCIPLPMHKVVNAYHCHCLCIPYHTIPYNAYHAIPYHTIPYHCQCIPYNGKEMHIIPCITRMVYHTTHGNGIVCHTIPYQCTNAYHTMARQCIPLPIHKVVNAYHCQCIPSPMYTIPYHTIQCISYHTTPLPMHTIQWKGNAYHTMHNTDGIPYHTRQWYTIQAIAYHCHCLCIPYHAMPCHCQCIPYNGKSMHTIPCIT
jgi:hypothetical protein